MRFSAALCLCAAALCAACNAPAQHEAVAASRSPDAGVSVPNNGIIPGTPEGDLGDWVRDIREGIAKLPELAAKDAPAAQKAAIELYVTRQEYDEMYYGIEGRNRVSDELAQAIETAEQRFHELMKLLGDKAPADAAVRASVAALDEQQALVAKLWRATGAHINRPTE